jgi:hypothetical protein
VVTEHSGWDKVTFAFLKHPTGCGSESRLTGLGWAWETRGRLHSGPGQQRQREEQTREAAQVSVKSMS